MYPKVTVVIPFYNCPYVDRAITSVLNQTYPNIEVIVVDDGSTRHANLIDPYKKEIYYLGKANGGTASAMNHGISNSSGQYIAWLSSDDKYKPDKIQRQMDFMCSTRSHFSFTAYALMDASDKIQNDYVGTPLHAPGDIYRILTMYNPINGCTMIARRELFKECGLFNESLPYTQDYEMWLRLALMGVKLDYFPEALTIYRMHEQMGSIRHHSQLIEEFHGVQMKYRDQMHLLQGRIV
ncbi:MAG: glycosyl transferase [Paenibacillaceae bacterium]|jgi:glycosyltransferase involved in cell wall biosynthesis|nr:glycosyl transferase [Paenibacillaceae bacterium]